MAANIKLKRSAVQSRVPTTTDLELGELGLNTYDGKVYMKKDDGTAAIVEVGGGGGAVDSVNTLTGAVSLGIEDLDDFELNPADSQRTWTYSSSSLTNPGTGLMSNWTGTSWMVHITDNNGDDASVLQSASGTQSVTVYVDGVSTYVGTITSWANQNNSRTGFQFADDSWKSSLTGGEEITLDMAMFSSGDQPLADGDILQYVSADSKFKPTQLPTAVSSIDDLSDVDTSTVAPTDGQVLAWDNTAGKWEPADDGGIPQNAQTSAYTLVSTDNGKHISITTGGVTVPSAVFSAGDTISIYNNSAADQTITQGASVTLRFAGTVHTGNRTLAQRGLATVLCVGSNEFVISGGGLS